MTEIDLAIFDLAGTTTRDTDHSAAALNATLSTLGLPIQPAEIQAVADKPQRDAIEQILLRYSPEQATSNTIDRLFAQFNLRLAELQKSYSIRPIEGAEEVFRWLRAHGIKVGLKSTLDRPAVTKLLTSLNWSTGVVDAVVIGAELRAGPPAPFFIFRAMELTGTTNVKRVAVLGDTSQDLEAGASAGVGMNVGVLSGVQPAESLEQAPHTHLIESVRKLPPLFAAPAAAAPPTVEVAPQPAELPPQQPKAAEPAPPPPPQPKPPEPKPTDPMGPGFTQGSGLP
jgi:phosphonatase-like hydrolase